MTVWEYLPLVRLDGQVALVTGAGRGIGRAIALALSDAGAAVALCARSADEISAVAGQLSADPKTQRDVASRCLVLEADRHAVSSGTHRCVPPTRASPASG